MVYMIKVVEERPMQEDPMIIAILDAARAIRKTGKPKECMLRLLDHFGIDVRTLIPCIGDPVEEWEDEDEYSSNPSNGMTDLGAGMQKLSASYESGPRAQREGDTDNRMWD